MFFSLVLIAHVTVCAQEFKTSVQKGVDLKKYETFSILKGEIVTGEDRKIDKESFYSEFRKIAIQELKDRGYTLIEDSTAQLLISYVVQTSRVIETEDLGPLGQMPQSNSGSEQTQSWSREFSRATLIIAVEAGKGNSVWTSEGTMEVGRTREVSILEYSVKNALQEFPNRKRKRTKKG